MKKEQRAMHLAAIEEKVAFCLYTYLWFQYRKNMKEKKSINALKLIKRV